MAATVSARKQAAVLCDEEVGEYFLIVSKEEVYQIQSLIVTVNLMIVLSWCCGDGCR
jgi:hypothetical protein